MEDDYDRAVKTRTERQKIRNVISAEQSAFLKSADKIAEEIIGLALPEWQFQIAGDGSIDITKTDIAQSQQGKPTLRTILRKGKLF